MCGRINGTVFAYACMSMSRILVTIVAVSLFSLLPTTQAFAQVGPGSSQSTHSAEIEPYNPQIAGLIPWTLTAVSTAAMVIISDSDLTSAFLFGELSLLVTPSAGHLYTHDWRRAALGMGIRTGGLVLFVRGVLSEFAFDDCVQQCDNPLQPLIFGGLAILAGGVLYSLIDAPASARRQNKKSRQQLMLAPMIHRDPNGRFQVGAQLGLRF